MKTEMLNPNTNTPKLRRKTVGQKIRPRGLPKLPAPNSFPVADRASPALPQVKRNGGTRKLRVDAGWRRFTQPEQDKIREIFERDGEMEAEKYCREIGKPWSHTAISRLFAKERATRQAEDAEIRKEVEWINRVTAAYARAGMRITEAMAFQLAAKLRDAVKISQANPETTKGRAIIMKAAPHLIALRALELRREFKSKEVSLAERRVAVQEKKLARALPKNEEVPKPNMEEHSAEWHDQVTDALGRQMFGAVWDLEDRVAEPQPQKQKESEQTTAPIPPSLQAPNPEPGTLNREPSGDTPKPTLSTTVQPTICNHLQPSATIPRP